jgi:hypothetical protein
MKGKNKMGLESHVDRVLMNYFSSKVWHKLFKKYHWNKGDLLVDCEGTANRIMKVLDESQGFGPLRYDPVAKKIEFGVHHWIITDELKYQKYCDRFKAWEIDRDDY